MHAGAPTPDRQRNRTLSRDQDLKSRTAAVSLSVSGTRAHVDEKFRHRFGQLIALVARKISVVAALGSWIVRYEASSFEILQDVEAHKQYTTCMNASVFKSSRHQPSINQPP